MFTCPCVYLSLIRSVYLWTKVQVRLSFFSPFLLSFLSSFSSFILFFIIFPPLLFTPFFPLSFLYSLSLSFPLLSSSLLYFLYLFLRSFSSFFFIIYFSSLLLFCSSFLLCVVYILSSFFPSSFLYFLPSSSLLPSFPFLFPLHYLFFPPLLWSFLSSLFSLLSFLSFHYFSLFSLLLCSPPFVTHIGNYWQINFPLRRRKRDEEKHTCTENG